MSNGKPKLIVILGPTAAGKTKYALALAQECNGEIISADSRQIYKGMDIGTCKATTAERGLVPHHLVDVVTPNRIYTLADWQKAAFSAIDSVIRRKKIPLLVGGTGLYISSIVENYNIDQSNATACQYEVLIIGIGSSTRRTLYSRINRRVVAMVKAGLEKEVLRLKRRYPWTLPSMQTIGYQEWQAYFSKKATKRAVIEKIQQHTRNYAKRQMTWFRGMEKKKHNIQWVTSLRQAQGLVKHFQKK